jgi:hypothetical protein
LGLETIPAPTGRGFRDLVFFWGGGKGGRCVGLTNLPLSCAECLEI